jgi:hypothetical protein
MKTIVCGIPMPGRVSSSIILLSIALLPCRVCSQTAVTRVWTHWQTAATSKVYLGTGATGNYASGLTGNTYNYQFGAVVQTPNNLLLDSFVVLGLNYHFQNPTTVKFRRVNNAAVTGLRKSLTSEQNSNTTINNGGTAKLLPAYDDSLERIFSAGDIFNVGIDNNFQNASTTNNNNIERVDHILGAGAHTADATTAGFVVFDRGTAGTHDPFYIAAIKTLDANGDPASYYNAVSIAAGNYGSNVGGAFNFLTLRKNDGDPGLLLMNNSTSQNRDGVFLRFSDLGVANNAVTYGYSLFGPDVVVSPASNLVNYSDAANFPTGSDFSNGGLDQVAVTGLWVTNNAYVVLAETVNDLSATVTGKEVQLGWDLSLQDNIGSLAVERSGDGNSYTPLMALDSPAAGYHNAVDPRPLPGKNYYRIKLVDHGGSTLGYSPVAVATFGSAATYTDIRICPNPIEGRRLFVTGEGLQNDSYTMTVYTITGAVVLSRQVQAGPVWFLDIGLPASLPAGVYFFCLKDKKETISIKQFVVAGN